jgi:hypothetical protein
VRPRPGVGLSAPIYFAAEEDAGERHPVHLPRKRQPGTRPPAGRRGRIPSLPGNGGRATGPHLRPFRPAAAVLPGGQRSGPAQLAPPLFIVFPIPDDEAITAFPGQAIAVPGGGVELRQGAAFLATAVEQVQRAAGHFVGIQAPQIVITGEPVGQPPAVGRPVAGGDVCPCYVKVCRCIPLTLVNALQSHDLPAQSHQGLRLISVHTTPRV